MNSLHCVLVGTMMLAPWCARAGEPAKEPVFADRTLSQWISDLDDADALVREEAIEVLGRIGAAAKPTIPKLEKIMATDSDAIRRRAAVSIWKIDGRTGPAKELLIPYLKASKGSQRLQTIQTLRQLGVPAANLAPHLIALVVDTDYAVSNPATTLLQEFGKEGVPALAAALPKAHRDPGYRLISLITNLGPDAKPLVPILQKMLKESDPQVRMACARTLWFLNEDRKGLAKLVVDLSRDKNPTVQMEAIQFALMMQPKPKEFEPVFREALKSANTGFRYQAVHALWEMDPKSLKENLKILIDGVKEIGRNGNWYTAVQSLTNIGPDAKEALPALLEALDHPNGVNSAYMLAPAIARMGPDGIEPLAKYLGSTNLQLQQASRQALQNMGPEILPKLLPQLNEKDQRVRLEILTIMSGFGVVGKDAVPKLVELAKGPDQSIRSRAVSLLAQAGPDAADATPELVKLLAQVRNNTNEMQQIIRALAQIGPGAKAAVPELKKLLTHEQIYVKALAAESLLQIDPGTKTEAVPVLLGILRDKKVGFNVTTLPGLLLKSGVGAAEVTALLRDYIKAQPGTKQAVISALNALPTPMKESTPLLLDLMKEANANIRHEAALALARLGADGKDSLPELRAMLKIPTNYWRDRALFAIRSLGPAAEDALPDLFELWRSTAPLELRVRYCEPILAIGKDKGKPVLEWLRGQSSAANVYYRAQVLRILAIYDAKNPEVLKNLLVLARTPQSYYAAMAFDAIGLMGEEAKAALPEIRVALKDADLVKRTRAASTLWRIEGKVDAALPVLIAALSEHDPVPRGAYYTRLPRSAAATAAITLAEMGPAAKSALPALHEATKLGDLALRQNAMIAIGKIDKK